MKKKNKEMVNHPSHYTAGGLEVIDILRVKMTSEQFEGFLLGNALKYLLRYRNKINPLEDVRKAAWYVNALIRHLDKTPILVKTQK